MTARRRYTYVVEFSENNSGGDWWFTQADYDELKAEGWDINGRTSICNDAAEPDCPRGAYLSGVVRARDKAAAQAMAYDDALSQWETVTSRDASEPGCSCCGPPYNFHVEEVKLVDTGAEHDKPEMSLAPALRGHAGGMHWDFEDAPEWIKEQVPLNGDDISVVSLIGLLNSQIDKDDLNTSFYCTVLVTWCEQGLLVWGFHA